MRSSADEGFALQSHSILGALRWPHRVLRPLHQKSPTQLSRTHSQPNVRPNAQRWSVVRSCQARLSKHEVALEAAPSWRATPWVRRGRSVRTRSYAGSQGPQRCDRRDLCPGRRGGHSPPAVHVGRSACRSHREPRARDHARSSRRCVGSARPDVTAIRPAPCVMDRGHV